MNSIYRVLAVTTYFNPGGYASRRANYDLFRSRLGLPLLTVEYSQHGQYELRQDSADIMVRVSGGDILWQKERLLNVALANLPTETEVVVWLDCDIVFDSEHWHLDLQRKVSSTPLVQCFSHLVDLRHGELPEHPELDRAPSGYSIASLYYNKSYEEADFLPASTARFRRALFGLAWAADRRLFENIDFYDAMILGSGDRALACAAFGKTAEAVATLHLSRERTAHYLRWADRFSRLVSGKVGFLDQQLKHLWHGSIEDRQYLERHQALSLFDFDPGKHLLIGQSGAWEWTDHCPQQIKEYVRDYFNKRNEDG